MFGIKKLFYNNTPSNSNKQINLLKKSYNSDKDINKEIHNIRTITTSSVSGNDVYNIFKEELYEDDKYKIIKTIHSKGTTDGYCFGAVYLVKDRYNNKYILKLRSCPQYSDQDNINEVVDEVQVFKLLKEYTQLNEYHENIIKPCEYKNGDCYHYFIYEYFNGINLGDYMKRHKRLNQNTIIKIFKQIVSGLAYLHNLNIIHGDLKLENVVINKDYNIKIIDFDLSTICTDIEGYIGHSVCGTIDYIAPESYDLCIYSKKSDIWSLGIILYMMMTGKPLYSATISFSDSYNIISKRNEFKHLNINYKGLKEKYDERLVDLLKQMVSFKDYKRLDAVDIYNRLTII